MGNGNIPLRFAIKWLRQVLLHHRNVPGLKGTKKMVGWFWLIGSIVGEVVGTTFLKLASDGGKHTVWYSIGVAAFYVTSFVLLSRAMRYFSLSTVYATWSGLGVLLLAVIGVIAFGDQINALKIISIILVIAGIVGLNASGMSH